MTGTPLIRGFSALMDSATTALGHAGGEQWHLDAPPEFNNGEQFHALLAHERKRTERSQKPIVLVLLDIHRLGALLSRRELSERLRRLLALTTREIDIKGWYETGHTVGVIYTEVSEAGIPALMQKIRSALAAVFLRPQASMISLSFAVFPDGSGTEQRVSDVRFYPENHSAGRRASAALKRAVDVIGALTLIILFLPFFIVISLGIVLSSRGPVFFTQRRLGLYGKPFTFLKFRSMYADNDAAIHREYIQRLITGNQNAGSPGHYKLTNDPRITPFGRLLRKTSLDELPQLFNVLAGTMSLVGPRPALTYEIEFYSLWHWRRLLETKPGLTGLWQVEGRSRTTFEAMVRLDLRYIRQRSFFGDLMLLFRTPAAMVRGAY